MIVQLNWRYKFNFVPPFDSYNGIYNVTKIYSFEELIQDRIDLSQLYSAANIADQYDEDLPLIRVEPIYKLINVRDENNVVFIPQCLIAFEPDATVKKYYNSVVTWNISAFADKEQLEAANDVVSQLIERLFGTEEPPVIIDIGVLWLTDQEYEAIENERKTKKDAAFNWFSENQRILLENEALKVKCTELENIIKSYITP